jgi:hypothetical protein
MTTEYRIFEVLATRYNRYYYELVEDDNHSFPLIGRYRTKEEAELKLKELKNVKENNMLA